MARKNLIRGATQIKLALRVGVSSNFDPVDLTEYTKAEIKAAHHRRGQLGIYVTVHGYTREKYSLVSS